MIALQNDQRWCDPEGGNTFTGLVERRRLGSLETGLLFSVWRLRVLPSAPVMCVKTSGIRNF